jgi:MFS family permease
MAPIDVGAFLLYSAKDPHLRLHKAVYFLLCAGQVCFNPFLPLLLSASGLTPSAIGLVLALRPLALLLATPVFGYIADRGYRRIVLVGAIIASTLLRGAVVTTTSQYAICAFSIAGEAASAPIFAVLDAAILGLLEKSSSTSLYGQTRMAGSVGYGALAPIAGSLRDVAGPQAAVALFVALSLAAAWMAWWLPFEREAVFHSPVSDATAVIDIPTVAATDDDVAGSPLVYLTTQKSTSSEPKAVLGAPPLHSPSIWSLLRPSNCALFSVIIVMGMLGSFIANFQLL